MTRQFVNNRRVYYVTAIVLSAVVLGIAANLIDNFGSSFADGFLIYALVVASLNILFFILNFGSRRTQPRFERILLALLTVLWLVAAAWATDIVGNTRCSALGGSSGSGGGGGGGGGGDDGESGLGSRSSCRQLKVIQAFSWALFASHLIALYVLHKLTGHAKRFGRHDITYSPLRDVPWFHETPGYYANDGRQNRYVGYPQYQAGGPQMAQPGVPIGAPAQQPQVTHVNV